MLVTKYVQKHRKSHEIQEQDRTKLFSDNCSRYIMSTGYLTEFNTMPAFISAENALIYIITNQRPVSHASLGLSGKIFFVCRKLGLLLDLA